VLVNPAPIVVMSGYVSGYLIITTPEPPEPPTYPEPPPPPELAEPFCEALPPPPIPPLL